MKKNNYQNPVLKRYKEWEENLTKDLDPQIIKSLKEGASNRPAPNREEFEKAIIDGAKEFRAFVIEGTVQVEAYFDEVLVSYFCISERRNDFIKMCLEKDFFTLSKKVELCKKIGVKICGSAILKERFGTDYPSILEKFPEQRNKVAHVKFNPSLFNVGDTRFLGDELEEKGTNKISVIDAAHIIMFAAEFAGYLLGYLGSNK